MKKSIRSAMHCNRHRSAYHRTVEGLFQKTGWFLCSVFFAAFFLTSCTKEGFNETNNNSQLINQKNAGSEFVNFYQGLPQQTTWELQQARAATAQYGDINNAIRDGYADINVVVQEMGFHYLKSAYVDNNFDFRKPEILVYNREENGSTTLVAVEYAVPISLSPNSAPTGFTGDLDVWDYNTTFGLWLLHAWVWAYNPAGVFNPTNPLIHLH